jgi:hypothetical protein
MPPHPEQSAEHKEKRGMLWMALFAVSLLLAWPLSLGPLAWLANHGYLERIPKWLEKTCEAFYAPLALPNERFPWLGCLLKRYLSLWVSPNPFASTRQGVGALQQGPHFTPDNHHEPTATA